MKKLFTSMFLVLTLLTMTAGTAFAQDVAHITGTVQTVLLETDAVTGETSVTVTVLDETTGTSQTVKISLETAVSLGLVTTDATTSESTVTETATGMIIDIDPTTTVPEEVEVVATETEHPVGTALSAYFGELLGVDYETIMTYHEDGVGFGVMARALWLSNSLDGDQDTFTALIDAKQSGDYSAITLADGSTPDNWGDVVKSMRKGDNLGSVMSNKDKKNESESEVTTETMPESLDNGHGNNGNGNNGNHGNGGNGNGHGHGNGNGRP